MATQPVENICSRLKWEEREEEHTHPGARLPNSRQCGILLFLLVLSWSNAQQPHHVFSGEEKVSGHCRAGEGGVMGTSALWRHLKSHLLIACGKYLGCTPPDHQWCSKRRKIGESMRKEAKWMQSELWARGRPGARGQWSGPSGDIGHLGTLSGKDQTRMKFSPTEVTEKGPLAHATWKTMSNPSDIRALKTSSGEQLPWERKNKASKGLTHF